MDQQTDKLRQLCRLKICSSCFHIRQLVQDNLSVQMIHSSSNVKTAINMYATISPPLKERVSQKIACIIMYGKISAQPYMLKICMQLFHTITIHK